MKIKATTVSPSELKLLGVNIGYYVNNIYALHEKYLTMIKENMEAPEKQSKMQIEVWCERFKHYNLISDSYVFANTKEEASQIYIELIKNQISLERNKYEQFIKQYKKEKASRSIMAVLKNIFNVKDEILDEFDNENKVYDLALSEIENKVEFIFKENPLQRFIVPENYKELLNGIDIYVSYNHIQVGNGLAKCRLPSIADNQYDDSQALTLPRTPFFIEGKKQDNGDVALDFLLTIEKFGNGTEITDRKIEIKFVNDDGQGYYTLGSNYVGFHEFLKIEDAKKHQIELIENMRAKLDNDLKLISNEE